MMEYSVVIPAYNAANSIGESIESTLQQTVPPKEIIVVDDGSTDHTSQVAEKFGNSIKVLLQTNQGPGAAMSLGMCHSKSPFIASIDSDDIWLPKKMELQLDFLGDNENCAGVFSQVELFGEDMKGQKVQDGWLRSTMTIRRKLYEVIGDVVDPPGMRGEMIDWISRAREGGFLLHMIPKVLARRRVSLGSLSNQRDPLKDRGYLHVARAALLRKRASSKGTENK